MHVETIEMDPRIARIYYSDYLKKVREARVARAEKANILASTLEEEAKKLRISLSQQEKEDLELLSAYRTLSTGQRIINMHKIIWGAGLDDEARPLLAIAPANWKKVFFRLEDQSAFFQKESHIWKAKKNERYVVPLSPHAPDMYRDREERKANVKFHVIDAVVPTIPAHLRPADLSEYWILWEAEWRRTAPKDPLLLQKIKDSNKFFIILAQWDLTPLEQQVLEGRFS